MEALLAMRDPAASLTDDLFVQILSRLPVKSLCCCKGVSRPWRQLISHPDHRKKLPQTLAGFFYRICGARSFTSVGVTGKGIPFVDPSFLPAYTGYDTEVLDCCNGLLLFRCSQFGLDASGRSESFRYAVCNPATKKWVTLPDGDRDGHAEYRIALLCFDPTVSSHFHVVEYVVYDCGDVTGVQLYSSKTTAWNFKKCGWGDDVMIPASFAKGVFLNGYLHTLTGYGPIVAVDTEGESWRMIPIASNPLFCSIHQTQGSLCLVSGHNVNASKLSISILEDYGTKEWTLKYTITSFKLFGQRTLHPHLDSKMIALHPDCNLIFFVFVPDNILMAYDIDRREVRVISSNIGFGCFPPFLPYVPLFEESLADEH